MRRVGRDGRADLPYRERVREGLFFCFFFRESRGREKKTHLFSLSFSLSPFPLPTNTRAASRSTFHHDDSDEEDENRQDENRCHRRRRRNNAAALGPSFSASGARSARPSRSYPLAPALIPTRSVYGHLDWVFGLDWITERHLVTGSRDRTLALWVSRFLTFFGVFFRFQK